MEKLEIKFNRTTITNSMQMLEDDEVEDQSSAKESQHTSKDEETMLANAP